MSVQKILVPLDGTATSEAALPVAEAIARRAKSSIAIIRAVTPGSIAGIADAEHYLSDVAESLSRRGVNVETGVPVGQPASWIIEEIELRHTDLVVMATHDRTGPDRWLHGSVAEFVISRSTVPVMVVHGAAPVERFEQAHPVVLVPLDGSELAEAALHPARALAFQFGARLALVSVVPRTAQMIYAEGMVAAHNEDTILRLLRQSEGYLQSVANRMNVGLVVERTVLYGDPATEITGAAEDVHAAAIVMATHGRTGVVRTLLGSIAGQVVHATALPVVLVRPTTLRVAEEPVARTAVANA